MDPFVNRFVHSMPQIYNDGDISKEGRSTVCSEHSKKSSSAHIGNWFVHIREQTVSKFVYLEFHIWKLLGNELSFQTVSNLCILLMHILAYPLHTNLILWKLFAHYLHTLLCLPCNLFIANHLYIHSYQKILF